VSFTLPLRLRAWVCRGEEWSRGIKTLQHSQRQFRLSIMMSVYQRCKVQGSESKSPAMCLFHPWTQLTDFTNYYSVWKTVLIANPGYWNKNTEDFYFLNLDFTPLPILHHQITNKNQTYFKTKNKNYLKSQTYVYFSHQARQLSNSQSLALINRNQECFNYYL